MEQLSREQRRILDEVVEATAAIPGVEAIALGGSHARGRARPESDLDVGLYYSESARPSLADVASACRHLQDAPGPVIADVGEWGPWADGGVWLCVRGQRVDWIYRSLERIDRVITDAEAGRYELHYGQMPPYGFFSPTYLGEVAIAIPLRDEAGLLAKLKERVAEYPEALRRNVIQDHLWAIEFGLEAFARKFARRGDVYGTAGCLGRAVHQLTLVLFALNRVHLLNDKTVMEEIDAFALAPRDFVGRVRTVLARPGGTSSELAASVAALREVFGETAMLAGELYQSRSLPQG